MDILEMYPEDLEEYFCRKNATDYLLVDVREPEEYEAEHIPGAKLLPLSELEARLGELPEDRELIFYCKSGWRSNLGAMLAGQSGFVNISISNLIGGISAWEGETVTFSPPHGREMPEPPDFGLQPSAV